MKRPQPNMVPMPTHATSSSLNLDVMMGMFLESIDGRKSIAQIGEQWGLDSEISCKIAADLLGRQLLTIEGFNNESISSEPVEHPTLSDFEKEINRIFESLDTTNYYDLLDVDTNEDRAGVRTKYFELSKRFHPDKSFGNEDQRHKMEQIFRHLTQAYDTLSNSNLRAQYDLTIPDELAIRAIGRKLKSAVNNAESAQTTPPSKPPEQDKPQPERTSNNSSDSAPKPASSKRPSAAERNTRRQQWKRERAGKALAVALGQSIPPSPPPTPNSKRRSISAQSAISEAKLAVDQERFKDAIMLLGSIEGKEAASLLSIAKKGETKRQAKDLMSKGLHKKRQGLLDDAVYWFESALLADPSSMDARHLIAEVLLEKQTNVHRAITLMKEVVGMGGQRARYFGTLGELFLISKENSRASEAFKRAVAIEPNNKHYRKRLKAC